MKTLVNVKDLSVSYFTYAGEVQSVRGVSFDIESGKTTALVGESGCGKSVTSKALTILLVGCAVLTIRLRLGLQ